jgi:hypothetical protein
MHAHLSRSSSSLYTFLGQPAPTKTFLGHLCPHTPLIVCVAQHTPQFANIPNHTYTSLSHIAIETPFSVEDLVPHTYLSRLISIPTYTSLSYPAPHAFFLVIQSTYTFVGCPTLCEVNKITFKHALLTHILSLHISN